MAEFKFRRWLATGGLLAAVYVGGNVYHPTIVCGNSMKPTLPDGRVIWVDRLYFRTHQPHPGDVVVFRLGDEVYIKRVYRGPGQTLHYLASEGSFMLPMQGSYVEEVRRRYSTVRTKLVVETVQVPYNAMFVLGDNFANSIDSRQLGMIPLSALIGRARVASDLSPISRIEFVPDSFPTGRRRAETTAPSIAPLAEDSSLLVRADPSASRP